MATESMRARPGVIVTHPNREKATVQSTRAAVVFLLALSAALIAVITVTGWKVLEGAQPLEIGYVLVYALLALLAVRWNRGALPSGAALAVFLIIFAVIAAPGWFEHEKHGFTAPSLNADLLGVLTLLLIPIQALLVAFSIRGFQQGWNVEVEVRQPSTA